MASRSSQQLAGLVMLLPAASRAQLQVGFYDTTCPNAEALVRQAVTEAFAKGSGIAAGLIRLHFHDCFVNGCAEATGSSVHAVTPAVSLPRRRSSPSTWPRRRARRLKEKGCDASVLLVSANGTAERDAVPNKPSLRGFEVIDAAKAAVEKSCPLTVSCADILAFAARDSINLTGQIVYQVPSGRRDGNISLMKDADENLPLPTFTVQQLIHLFAKKTLTAEEMVTLVGAHTIGRSFCSSFLSRIWNNTNPIVDEGLSSGYAKLLRSLCPSTPNNSTTTVIDPSTPTVLDNNYYELLPLNLGLFFSDNQLRTNAALNASVNTFADSEALWNVKFWEGMIKMGNIEVLTGTQGEIRLNCSVVNKITGMEMAHYYSGSASSVDEIVTS